MSSQEFERKLTAILSADVAGYSRLMGEDEDFTIKTLTGHREMMAALIREHKGRVVDSPGDNLLAVFSSVTRAVNCAVEIQREMAERNEELPDDRKMEYRIGVNLGDVIEEGDRIYGDGVNIAARLESLSEPGGICISGFVYNQLKNRLKLEYEYLGEQSVKNIKEPVPVYRVLSFPGAAAHRVIEAKKAAQEEKMALPLPDKPSIAVLPFDNLSKNPDQEYLADGITDQIITGLSMMPYIFVIARNSSFIYKGTPVKVQQVAEELGVQYVLEGSVQQSGNRIRVTAQLVDALTGHHVWSERYDRVLEDIFTVQDEIMMNITRSMDSSLVGPKRLKEMHTPQSVEAYFKILKGLDLAYHFNKDDNLLARELYQEAMSLDPEYGHAYEFLGWTYHHEAVFGWSDDWAGSLRQAEKFGEKAIALGDTLAHELLMRVYSLQGKNNKAIAEAEKLLLSTQILQSSI
jgi:adenylate cyclase